MGSIGYEKYPLHMLLAYIKTLIYFMLLKIAISKYVIKGKGFTQTLKGTHTTTSHELNTLINKHGLQIIHIKILLHLSV